MNLRETYARVIAARPDAAVPGLDFGSQFGWVRSDSQNAFEITNDVAEALILRHWIGLMPTYAVLWKVPTVNNGTIIDGADIWRVGVRRLVSNSDEPTGTTPIDALAEYLTSTAPQTQQNPLFNPPTTSGDNP